MSLQTRLTALAQAVGADIKALKAYTGPYVQCSSGATVAASGSFILPIGAIAEISNSADFTRNSNGTITVNKTGVYTVSAAANCENQLPANARVQFELDINSVASVYQSVHDPWGQGSISWTGKLVAGTVLRISGYTDRTTDTARCVSFGVAATTGAKGDKGDPGGVNVVTTLDWNTALTPNFYRSVYDEMGMQQTVNGPGDTINFPPQAGIVSAHENGRLVQRVWDLDMNIPYTRYRLYNGTWTAWATDLANPPVYEGVMAGTGGPGPQDGDERYIQSNAMKALGILWRFRYDGTAPVGKPKWIFAGGSSWVVGPVGSITTSSQAPVLMTNGPTFTAPVPGDYDIDIEGFIQQQGEGLAQGNLYLGKNGVNTGVQPLSTIGRNTYDGVSLSGTRSLTLGEGDVVSIMCATGNVMSINYSSGVLVVAPRRVNM